MPRSSTTFKPGKSGNPKGRPKKGSTDSDDLQKAIKKVAKEKRIDVYEQFVRRAYENDAVLISVIKKMIPDLKHVDKNVESNISAVVNLAWKKSSKSK